MSFRTGTTKPARPPLPKGKGGLSFGGISFKQLEEDEEEEENLSVYTGKYDKVLDESQKSIKQHRESRRLSSTSSNSSTSSGPEDVRHIEKCKREITVIQKQNSDGNIKQTSVSMDNSDSPLKKTAKAKLESSKELFSGLKGKISDKISKTIEEFSNDSATLNSGAEREKQKEDSPVQGVAEKEFLYQSHVPIAPIVKESVTVVTAVPFTEARHPLAPGNGSDNDDVEEDLTVTEKDGEEDSPSVFHAPGDKSVNSEDILVLDKHFTNDPSEDFTGMPALMTFTQVKSRSKIKNLIPKKSPKTLAVASLSGLTDLPSERSQASPTRTISNSKDDDRNVKSTEKIDKPQVLSSKSSDTSKSKGNVSQQCQSANSISVLRQLSTDYAAIPYSKAIAIIIALFAFMIVPLPSFVSGLAFGVLLASAGWAVYLWLMQPPLAPEPLVLPPLEDMTPPVPEMKQTIPSNDHMYKGWMNESTDYNVDDYHINKTHSVFVSLEGTHLRLQRPKNPAPKRAMWDETISKPQFIHQRHFDLHGSKVFLMPHGIVKKRIWSKKYPICISLTSKTLGSDGKETLKHTSSEPSLEKQREMSDMGFEIVTDERCKSNILYLFARTGREKEEWFKKFSAAAGGKPLGNHILEMKQVMKESNMHLRGKPDCSNKLNRENSSESMGSSSSQVEGQSDAAHTEGLDLLTFSQYMGRLMPASSASSSRASSPTHAPSTVNKDSSPPLKNAGNNEESPRVMMKSAPIICDNQLFWLNALIGRCFFDFLRDKWWIGKVTEKLQKKLSKIHVPYFIEELQVSSIEMGYEIPAIRHAGRPYMDERGFWVDLDITYSGGFKMTIETKMNLMRLKKSSHTSTSVDQSIDQTKSPITDSEEEDSAESSTDEEEEVVATDSNVASGGGTSKKFLRYLNKITQSKYFQQATEYKVVRRAMENVSNTPLTLTVTVNSLVGKLAVNIPPPPSDRLWYGFRGNPRLRLSAKPQVGERAVTISHVTDWIEKKLAVEFQRVFVMPNMDDLVIPILVPGEVNGTAMAHSMSL